MIPALPFLAQRLHYPHDMTKHTKTVVWKYKVVKKQRGSQGEWFSYPTAGTFRSESDARGYAEAFAAEQKGVLGTRIVVLTRGGKFVAEYKPEAGAVTVTIGVEAGATTVAI